MDDAITTNKIGSPAVTCAGGERVHGAFFTKSGALGGGSPQPRDQFQNLHANGRSRSPDASFLGKRFNRSYFHAPRTRPKQRPQPKLISAPGQDFIPYAWAQMALVGYGLGQVPVVRITLASGEAVGPPDRLHPVSISPAP